MPRTSSYLRQLDTLSRQLASRNNTNNRDGFKELLTRVADVVREAENAKASDLAEVVEKAEQVFDAAIGWAYSAGDYDFLPSYAHRASESPLVQDSFHRFGHGTATSFLQLMGRIGQGPIPQATKDELLPAPWTASHPPHTKSTRLSRFRDGVHPSVTDATPRARMIYEARCEVAADSFPSPIQAAIAADSSVLTIIGQGGWKNREPVLGMYLLDEPQSQAAQGGDDGDDDVGDEDHGERIRTYGGFRCMCQGYRGPIATLPNGRVVRAGTGGAAIWNLDALETHEHGRVGNGRIRLDDLFVRDNDNNEIERSVGSAPTTTLEFTEKEFRPAIWRLHAPTGHLLCAEDAREASRYGCFAIDLEQGGKKVARFLGHGGGVNCFSTSDGDAHTFATASSDGYARLFDVRRLLPVMTLDAGHSSEFCMAVQLIHPDGIPKLRIAVFTGGQHTESIKMWDIRARAIVYELATGNNQVEALAWDGVRNTLYAATECSGMDRLGYTHDYRPARIPRWADLRPNAFRDRFGMAVDGEEEDEEDADDEEYDSMEEDDDGRYWPKDAYHSEKHFGYAYDAGEHVLLRYQFKDDPDPTVLPEYGQGCPRGNDW
ncbi:hypothetical protein FKP32DRAFT_1605097 [Trametes sanguinea]|nr:hypothetical protein FKP32DRAFT_1605097 [Trametes sanguinea]